MKDFFKWGADLKRDIPSSVVVFLVALPLCLGIGVASGVEPISGLIAGIVGGIVVTAFSGSNLGVSGPAAGLVAIVLAAVEYFREVDAEKGFQMFLVAVMIGGILQVLMGVLKLGKLVAFFPGAVIRGMLAAIGIIIILKQIPHAFGYDKDYEGDLAFEQSDGANTFTEIGNVFYALFNGLEAIGWIPTAIFAAGIIITIIWSLKFVREAAWSRIISAPLMIVIVGAVVVYVEEVYVGTHIAGYHLVDLGGVSGVSDVFGTSPDFSILDDPRVYLTGLTLAIVASLESLLCMEATDKMDPEARHTPANQELIAQGIGNTVSGFLGGLPVTQVIVRSSANTQSGAKSKTSSFLHGWWLLLSVLLIPGVMEYVPLSALAAVLIVVGIKLAKPSVFKEYISRGWRQFVPFLVTIFAIVFTDLLVGIGIGFVCSLLIALAFAHVKSWKDLTEMFAGGKVADTPEKADNGAEQTVISINPRISFLSKAAFRGLAQKVEGNDVLIDLSDVEHIDQDGQDAIWELEDRLERQGKTVHKRGGALIK